MSREVKFRAWLTLGDEDENGNDIDHHAMATNISVHSDSSIGFTVGHAGDIFGIDVTEKARENDTLNEVDYEWCNWEGQCELMQYTGLKDKNGVEIYEGDIVKILYTDWPSQSDQPGTLEEYLDSIALTRVVIWSVQGFYVSHKVDGFAETMEPGTHGYIEVIGNIYENPELLRGA